MFRNKRQGFTAAEITSIEPVSQDEAEAIVTEFLDGDYTKDSIAKQLERLQRNLRGLPPLLTPSTLESEVHTPAPVEYVPVAEPGTLSKEQRKQAKKERRKQDKKVRALDRSKAGEDADDDEDQMDEDED